MYGGTETGGNRKQASRGLLFRIQIEMLTISVGPLQQPQLHP